MFHLVLEPLKVREMIKLHGSWQFSGKFFFWVEKEQGVPEEASTLERILEPLELPLDPPVQVSIFSPLRPDEPLTAELGLVNGKSIEVTGYAVPLDIALSIFTTARIHFPEGFEFGASYLFWREASCLVLEFLCRGCFLPGVSRYDGLLASSWFPVFPDESARERFQVLSDSMPLAACVATDGKPFRPDSTEQALRSFIERSTDTLVRLFLPQARPIVDGAGLPSLQRHALERWFEALWQKSSGRFSYLEPGLQGLVERLSRWQESVQPSSLARQGRVVFRLEALPATSTADPFPFCLTFGMLEGEKFFRPWEQALRGAQGGSDSDDESYFLRVLSRQADAFPPLRRGLQEAFPSRVLLSIGEAYEFLKHSASRIESEGHRVDLPNWWAERSKAVGLRLDINPQESMTQDDGSSMPPRASHLAAHQLLRFSWQIAVGDTVLTLEEFQSLSQSAVPFMNVGGKWVELEQSRVEQTLKFVESLNARKQMSLFELLKVGFEDDVTERFPILDIRSSGWVQHLFERESHPIPQREISSLFKGSLRSYQAEGVSWLSFLTDLGLGGCLADDMGLGKTIQLLALIASIRETGVHRPMLLVVPVSILSNWTQEISRFTPHLKWHVHHGSERLHQTAFEEKASNVDMVLTTYNLVYRDELSMSRISWSMIVLDEAQNIKNPDTKQAQAIRRMVRRSIEESALTGGMPCQRFALTGTPLENRLEELWSILEFLNPGILGTLPEFRKSFLVPVERGESKETLERLSRIVKPFVLRRLKSDPKILPDLPAKIEIDVSVPLTREQAMLYQTVLEEMMPELEHASGMRRRGLVLATITRLKQICDHPALFLRDSNSLAGRSQKLERLEQLLEEIFAEGDKVLLFTQFAEMGKLLKPYLEERFSREVLFLHGAVPKKDRDELVKRFQTREGPPLFLLSLKAGGFGLNLTEANHVIHYDQWWNPAVEDQASDRAHRIGQTRKVQIRRLICQGTLEEKIAELHIKKKQLAQEVLQVQDDALTELSFTELRQLFELKPEETTGGFDENEENEVEQFIV